MANKTTSNPKLQEQLAKSALQSQLAKIKKEEEEELWISGEELYTEGSSDEEECKMQLRSRRKINSIQSSGTSTSNHGLNQRNHLPSVETRTKSDCCSVDTFKDSINEKSVLKTVTQYDDTSFKTLNRSPSIELVTTDRLSTVESPVTSMTKDFSDFSTEEHQIENTEISWKAERELLYNKEEFFEDQWEDDINILNINAKDECIQKEILEMKNLDNLICAMTDKVKEAIEDTLFYQCENRKRLEKILASNPTETGKLAENTRQFFCLCPTYTTPNTEFRKNNEPYISLDNSKWRLLQSKDNVNLLNLDNEVSQVEWKSINSTRYIKDINNVMQDSYSNPYIVNTEIQEMLLDVKEKKNLSNEESQLLKQNNVFNTNSPILTFDNTSVIQNLQHIDNDVTDKVLKEAHIINPLSTMNVIEDENEYVK